MLKRASPNDSTHQHLVRAYNIPAASAYNMPHPHEMLLARGTSPYVVVSLYDSRKMVCTICRCKTHRCDGEADLVGHHMLLVVVVVVVIIAYLAWKL